MFCTKCGSPLPDSVAFCPKCGNRVQGMAASATPSQRERKGRGLYIVEQVAPNLSPDNQRLFLSLSGKLTDLPKYYAKISAVFKPNTPRPMYMEVGISCKDARFKLTPSATEKYYEDLFYKYYEDCQNVLKHMMQSANIGPAGSAAGKGGSGQLNLAVTGKITEFGQMVTFRPKEKTDELVPIFPMTSIWSRLFVRDFYERYGVDKGKLYGFLRNWQELLTEEEAALVERMGTRQTDYRAFISQNAEKIVSLSRKVDKAQKSGESWEEGLARDGGAGIKAKIDELMSKSPKNDVTWFFNPLTRGDVSAITEFTNKMLSASPSRVYSTDHAAQALSIPTPPSNLQAPRMGVETIRIMGIMKGYENGSLTIQPTEITTEVDGRVTRTEEVSNGNDQTFKVSRRIIPNMDEDKEYFLGEKGVITIQGGEIVNLDY